MNKRKTKKKTRPGSLGGGPGMPSIPFMMKPRKSKKARKGKRPNPAAGKLPVFPGFGDSVATFAIMGHLQGATVGEKMLIGSLIPMLLKFVRGPMRDKTPKGKSVSLADSIFNMDPPLGDTKA